MINDGCVLIFDKTLQHYVCDPCTNTSGWLATACVLDGNSVVTLAAVCTVNRHNRALVLQIMTVAVVYGCH